MWKDVVGYEGLYQVSNTGKVLRNERYKQNHSKLQYLPKIELKQQKMPNGYMAVYLTKDGNSKIQYVHRLVAMAFLDNQNYLPEVNHKDENKCNNCVTNLEWCTRKYNVRYGTGIKRRVENTDFSNPKFKEASRNNAKISHEKRQRSVTQYTLTGKKVREYKSATIAEKDYGFNASDINSCCRNKLRTAGGYIWRYTEEPLTKEHIDWCNEFVSQQVIQRTKDNEVIKIWNNAKEVQNKLGIHQSSIRRCCIGKQKTAGGYIWEYQV